MTARTLLMLLCCIATCAYAQHDQKRGVHDGAMPIADARCEDLLEDGSEACPESESAPSAEELQRMRQAHRSAAAYHARVAQALAGGDEPRDLALAVVLRRIAEDRRAFADGQAAMSLQRDAEAERWWQDAYERSGSDVLAQTLLLHAAKAGMENQRRQAATRWSALEPDNLAAMMAADAPVDTWLPTARRATRYDSHAYARLRWTAERLQAFRPSVDEAAAFADPFGRAGTDPRRTATIIAMGIWTAEWLTGFQQIVESCRGDALATPSRAADCRHVAAVLSDASDVMIAQGIGHAMQSQLAETGAERKRAEQARRRFHWQMHRRGEIASADPDADFTQFLRLLDDPEVRSEREIQARQLAEAGVPADPPDDWQSPWHAPGKQ